MTLILWDKCANGAKWRNQTWIFHFFFYFFPNVLACERCLNTSLCWLTTTSGLQYGPEKFTTHLKISHIYELIFTKFIANRKCVLKINEQLLKRTSAQNPLDNLLNLLLGHRFAGGNQTCSLILLSSLSCAQGKGHFMLLMIVKSPARNSKDFKLVWKQSSCPWKTWTS